MLAFGTLLCAGRSDLAGSSYFYGAGRGDVSGSALQVRPRYCRAPSTLPAASPGAKGKARDRTDEMHAGIQLCHEVLHEDELYEILGVGRKASLDEIRRAFLGRSRVIHPDKLPSYAPATSAFQRLSFAYETLSKPGSRRLYDLGGGRSYESARDATPGMGDETLNGVLRSVFTEFLDGDFEMIRVFVNALNEGNPGLNLGDEAVDNLEGAFRRVREALLAGQKYLRLLKFEIIRIYEIQHSLRSLSYFDLVGRLRLTLALTRVTLEIPMVLDKAMREEPVRMPHAASKARDSDESSEDEPSTWSGTNGRGGPGVSHGELQRRGLLSPRVKHVLVLATRILERGEKLGI